jgi:outer membrane protein assembly factor BamB
MSWLAGFMVAAGIGVVQAEDWPNYRGSNYDGISLEQGWSVDWPSDGPEVLWRAKVGTGFSSFSVADGRVYTMGNSGKSTNQDSVYCFDAVTGRELWRYTYDQKLDPKYYEGGPSATPTVAGGRVYTVSKTGRLLCLGAADGTLIWEKFVPGLVEEKEGKEPKMPTWGYSGSVLVVGDRLYLNVGTYGVALDLEGNLVWSTGSEASGYSTHVPVEMGGRKQLVVFAAEEVASVDPADGKRLWSHKWKTSYDVNAADPIVRGSDVFVSSGYGTGGALVRVKGGQAEQVWFGKDIMRNHHNNCVLVGDYLYGFDGDKDSDLKCVDFATGEVKWSHNGLGKGALMVADGKLVINSEMGELVIAAADPSGFKVLAQAQILGKKCWSAPVLANGRVYMRNDGGDVACVDLTK